MTLECIPRNSRPFRASTHVSAASYSAARSSVMLYFFFSFLDTKYIAAAPAYFTVIFSVKLKLPTIIAYKNHDYQLKSKAQAVHSLEDVRAEEKLVKKLETYADDRIH